jgi:phosphoribosylformylglycinamidine synthase
VDLIFQEEIETAAAEKIFAVEYLPGQYDQRADSAEQCIQILNDDEKPTVRVAQLFILKGDLSREEIEKINSMKYNKSKIKETSSDLIRHKFTA